VTVAVVGHVEWAEAVRVERLPAAGEIVHGEDAWAVAGGGGGITAVLLGRLAGEVHLFTALGDDDVGRRAHEDLMQQGVRVHAAWRPEPQRRALVHVDGRRERAITVVGPRADPAGDDDLPWHELDGCDAVFLTAGDTGAVRHARRAPVLVATSRAVGCLRGTGVRVDALVGSAADPAERYEPGDLDPEPARVLRTEAAAGGSWDDAEGGGRWEAVEPPGPPVDSFGCGDSFAAGLTYALGAGLGLTEAIEVAAREGAACAARPGPY
jgi:ribokinase